MLELPHGSGSEELRRFLVAFERMLPVHEPSNLAGRERTEALLEASEGITGNIAGNIAALPLGEVS